MQNDMDIKKIYISGKITGLPVQELSLIHI